MYIVFLTIVFAYVVATFIIGFLQKKKPKDDVLTQKKKCKEYIQGIASLWVTTLAVFIMSLIGGIGFAEIGFRPISFEHNIWFTVIVLALSGLALVLFVSNLVQSLTSAKWREKQIMDEGTRGVLPRTQKERKLFSFLALSAGICEEILYRGFVAFLLLEMFPSMPIFLIILIPGIIFGISHSYQGLQGVISTGLLGVLFMSLFLATNSLILPMLLHFIMDFSSTFVLSEKHT